MMDITKIQKIIRKAIKELKITSEFDEEIIVALMSADLFREMSGITEEPRRGKQNS